MIALWQPPIPKAVLSRLRLSLRRKAPSEGTGLHLRRRQGQSLEFREHRHYQPGDDIRHVDWLASARRPRLGPQDLLVRTFDAEEKMVLAIVLDVRPAMELPEACPKLMLALWWMLALVQIAVENGDEVVLGTIFGPDDGRPLRIAGPRAVAAARGFAARLWEARGSRDIGSVPGARPQAIIQALKPASAVVLISDMLFADADGAVLRLARAAQQARRELLVLELDSFDAEASALVAAGPVRRAAFEGREQAEQPGPIGADLIDEARKACGDHRDQVRRGWAGAGLFWPAACTVPTPPTAATAAREFATHFAANQVLRALLSRGASP